MSGDDGFLSRWSKRKKAVAESEAAEEEQAPASVADAGDAEAADEAPLSDEELLEKYGLKDPDTLEEGDDFAGFLRAAIPEHLRRRALRRLWRSNPVLANLDGLNDYDGDWTGGSVPAGEQLKTAYRVGTGYLRKLVEATDDEPAQERPDVDDQPDEDTGTADPESEAVLSAAVPGHADEVPVTEDEAPEVSDDHVRPARRRMAFRVPSQ